MNDWFLHVTAAFLALIQCAVTYGAIGELVKDEADREDVFLLIPLYWIIPFIAFLVDRIPKALKRPVRK